MTAATDTATLPPATSEPVYTLTLTAAEHAALVTTVSCADSPGRELEGPLTGAFDKLRTALPHAPAPSACAGDGVVWVVATFPDGYPGRVTDLEVLDIEPAWDLAAERQRAWLGNVNGGDSVPWGPVPPPCDQVPDAALLDHLRTAHGWNMSGIDDDDYDTLRAMHRAAVESSGR